jgi:4-hydroxy-tetrahydrodipicolinate synthase
MRRHLLRPQLISAVGTPLTEEEGLHIEGLHKHLDEQSAAKMDGILVAGTMGLMQLLADKTYHDLVWHSAECWKGRGELLVGVGDASYARTVERIRLVNDIPVDGVVVLSPYFFTFSQAELLSYYQSLADASRAPLFLYDLPQRTRTSLEIDTVVALAKHPNIAGIKCSGDIDQTRRLIKALEGSTLRVVVAQPLLVDTLMREGIRAHLDGVFSIAPHCIRQIALAAELEQWTVARQITEVLSDLLTALQKYGIFPAMTAILNAHGIPGSFAPRPFAPLSDAMRHQLLEEPAVIRARS